MSLFIIVEPSLLAVKLARHARIGHRLRLSINWGARCRSDCGRHGMIPTIVAMCGCVRGMMKKKNVLRGPPGRLERFGQMVRGSSTMACVWGCEIDTYVSFTISNFPFPPSCGPSALYFTRFSITRFYVIVCTRIAVAAIQ